jgi:hypothetical protein
MDTPAEVPIAEWCETNEVAEDEELSVRDATAATASNTLL